MEYGTVPANATLKPTAFQAHVPNQAISDFKQLLKLSKIGPETFENLHEDLTYGVSHKWIAQAKQYWETAYDWRKCEARINSFPNFTVPIDDGEGGKLTVHFAALFSQKPDAVPLILIHGWPGSFMEFFGILDILKSRFSPKDLPYHVIVPSIPGYAYSSGPPLTRDWTTKQQARVMNDLMTGLGFGSGYVTQGGDIGSFISRALVVEHPACKAVHLNFIIGVRPETMQKYPASGMSAKEQSGVERLGQFRTVGSSYGSMHATKPATIGIVLSSSPIALLAWIGEKFFAWTDDNPSLDAILDDVTLYWMTESFPRSIYTYRSFNLRGEYLHGRPELYIKKPFGYSWFPYELAPCPRSWAEETGDLSFWREHDKGGHFAAMEKPDVLLKDIEDFIAQVWPTASKL